MNKIDIKILDKYKEGGWLYNQTHPTLPLIIWNYSQQTQYERYWDNITLQCRGLVTDTDGNIIARPFKKFFNIEEKMHTPTPDFDVYEKMDGSLGLMFQYKGNMICATRGSFTSDQALWMTEFANRYSYSNIIVEGFTYLFEIIFPENRIVVDYGRDERLVLLGIIKTRSGKEIPLDSCVQDGWDIVNKYDGINDYSDLKKSIDDNQEGYVIRFSNGDRCKIKGEEYVRLHKIMTEISTKSVWEMIYYDKDLNEVLYDLPDEYFQRILDYENELYEKYYEIATECKFKFNKIKHLKRNEFAQKAKSFKHSGILFNMLDGKDYSKSIWKKLKPEFKKL